MSPPPAASYAFEGDARFIRTMSTLAPVNAAVSSAVRFFQEVAQHDLLGSAVRVSAKQFPDLYALVTRCAQALAIPEPSVYVTPRLGSINASTYGTSEESFVMLHSATVDHMTTEELCFVIGHECGHIDNGHVVYSTAARFLAQAAGTFLRWAVAPASVALNKWSRAAEVTADRAGLLCCRDVDVATRAIVKMGVGSRKLYDEVDVEAYLSQLDDAPGGLGRIGELFHTHPQLPKRVEAIRQFGRSAVYRDRVGEEGGLSRTTLDERVRDILKIW